MILYIDRSEVPDVEDISPQVLRYLVSKAEQANGRYDRLDSYYRGDHPSLHNRKKNDVPVAVNYAKYVVDITLGYYKDTYVQHLVRTSTYGQRNSYVLPAVHRLDVSLSHHGSIGIGEMICDLGIYNLYNQQNVSSVYWGYVGSRPELKGVCMFPIMPFISLTLKL